jgi:hypothetical protein
LVGIAIGVPLGFLWILILTKWKSYIFIAGTVLSKSGVAFATGGAMLTALAASLLPAFTASRVDPVEGMTSAGKTPSPRTPVWAALVGICLLGVDPFLIFVDAVPRFFTFYAHFFLGLPCLLFGAFLLAPSIVWLVEKLLAGLVARIMGIPPALLAQQLTGALWRAAGTAAALMVGLAILVVLQSHGHTLLKGWSLPTNFPDIFINSWRGLTWQQVHTISTVQGIKEGELLPLAIAQPGLEPGIIGLIEDVRQGAKWAGFLQDRTMFLGIEPYRAFRMMELDFRLGNPADAAYQMSHSTVTLKSGTRHTGGVEPARTTLAVPDPAAGVEPNGSLIIHWRVHDLQFLAKSDVESVAPQPEASGSSRVKLKDGTEIVGAIKQELEAYTVDPTLPGSRQITADAMAKREKTGRYLLVTDEFRKLRNLGLGDPFKLEKPDGKLVEYKIAGVVWSPGIDVFVQKFNERRRFGKQSAGSVFGTIEDARTDFNEKRINLLAANLVYATERPALEQRVSEKLGSAGLVYGDVREIKAEIENGLRKLIDLATTVALAAIAVASLGVINTIMASVRTRRWQLGVLRSIGVTRGQMLRLILSEGLLLGLVGCALGVGTGLLMTFNANGMSGKMIGYAPPIVIPWDKVGGGALIIMGVAFLASLWPAADAAREQPLELLQAGRAAA